MARTRAWRIARTTVAVLACLVLFAVFGLPLVIRARVNARLAHMERGYSGHIDEVEIHWAKQSLSALGLVIERPGREVGAPFLKIAEVRMAVISKGFGKWPVCGLSFREGVLNFIDAPGTKDDQRGPGFTLAKLRDRLPLDLGELKIDNLEVHFRNFTADPAVDAYVQDVHASVAPLDRCIQANANGCDARGELRGLLMRDGHLRTKTAFSYSHDSFKLSASGRLRALTMADLNPLLLRYAQLDVQRGRLDLWANMNVTNENYRLVLRPKIDDAKILGGERKHTQVKRELGVALAAKFLELLGRDLHIVVEGGKGREAKWDVALAPRAASSETDDDSLQASAN